MSELTIYLWKRDQGANSFTRYVWIDESHPQTNIETCVCRDAQRCQDSWHLGHTIPAVPRAELWGPR